MKRSPAALALLLAAAAALALCQAQGARDSSYCCPKHAEKPVPLRFLKSYHYSASSCALPSVILVTRKDNKICGSPEASWVQERIAKLPQQ